MGTILLLAYLAGCMLVLVPTSRWFLRETGFGPPDAADYVISVTLGMLCCWLWPFYIPGWWAVQMLKTEEE